MANCYNECIDFLKSKSEKDLGDITEQGSCSYCLYWDAGPAAERADDKHECKCDSMFENATGFGSYYNLNIHNQVKQCLNQNRGTCSNLYTQFTNPPKPYDGPRFGLVDGMWGRLERYQDVPPKPRFREYAQDLFKEGDHPYGYYNACTGKRANPGFSREGVL
jgi:hypothetical protein